MTETLQDKIDRAFDLKDDLDGYYYDAPKLHTLIVHKLIDKATQEHREAIDKLCAKYNWSETATAIISDVLSLIGEKK